MKKVRKKWFWILAGVCFIILGVGYWSYGKLFESNTAFEEKSRIAFVYEPIDMASWLLLEENQKVFKEPETLLRTASLKKLQTLKPGRYLISRGMNSSAIVNMLRAGIQEPLNIRTDNVTTLESLAAKMGKSLRSDSAEFIQALRDPEQCAAYGFNPVTVACMIMPNTYQFYWTMTPNEFLKKMNAIHEEFWSPSNIEKAKSLNLTKTEVCILASIVKAETAKTQEAPKIARLYLNRLRINMPLQSDPTAKFGTRPRNTGRDYFGDFDKTSPYNTYEIKGLPPGPINFPEKIYLEAVLNPENHSYLYMCAQPGGTGLHNFAKTLDQHNIYSRQYHQWLNQQGIR